MISFVSEGENRTCFACLDSISVGTEGEGESGKSSHCDSFASWITEIGEEEEWFVIAVLFVFVCIIVGVVWRGELVAVMMCSFEKMRLEDLVGVTIMGGLLGKGEEVIVEGTTRIR
jgi:hypothetical protein